MNIEQLVQLETVERERSISAAAKALSTTQPTLSRSLQRLERELGCELFDRTSNRLAFNDAGRIVLTSAHYILAEVRSMRDGLDALARRTRTVTVSSVAPAPNWRLVALTVERFPGVILEPRTTSEQAMEAALINNECDLGITEKDLGLPNVSCTPLMRENLFFSVPENHRLATNASARFADADGETFLVFEQVGIWMDLVRKALPTSQFIIQPDRTVFLQLLESTDLLAFTTDAPENTVELSGRVRVPIEDDEAHKTFYLCTRRDASNLAQEIFKRIASLNLAPV